MNIAHRFLLGRYNEGDTLVHRLDPRIKLTFIIMISVSLFFIDKLLYFTVPFLLLGVATLLSQMKIAVLVKGIIPILWLVMITFLLHAFIPPADIEYGANISLRIILLFGWACLLTSTTSAVNLGKSVAWFTKPFSFLGFNPSSIALTFSMALRFFPLILEEAESIIKAHRLRKTRLNIKDKMVAFITVFFIRLFKKADVVEASLLNREIISPCNNKIWKINKKINSIDILILVLGISYLGFTIFYL